MKPHIHTASHAGRLYYAVTDKRGAHVMSTYDANEASKTLRQLNGLSAGKAMAALVCMAFGAIVLVGGLAEPKPEPVKSAQRVKWERGRTVVQRQCDVGGLGYRQCAKLLEQYDAVVPRG